MQFSLGGARQVDGGTALAMESSALMIKLALYGKWKLPLLARWQLLNSNAMRQRVSGSLGPFRSMKPSN
jgi:hypothetical protein